MADSQTTPDDFDIADDQPVRALSWSMIVPAAGFYIAWCGLAFLSHLAGRSTIAAPAAALLLGAILITNLLLAILNLPAARAAVDSAVATAQAGLAIAWTTVYAVLAEGP